MREYSKVSPKFWIGATGKRLRTAGLEAQVVAMYLMTSPHANMLGLYYCPLAFMAHETGLGIEGALKGLQRSIEAGFCQYDEGSEVVWVMEMASYQVGDSLKPADLRVKGVQNEYEALPGNPFLPMFYEKYATAFCMSSARGSVLEVQAPSKPLPSQEQEQEQEQKKEQNKNNGASAPVAAAPESVPAKPKREPKSKDTITEDELVVMGVERQHAKDWLKARKAKSLPLTKTALDATQLEANKAGLTLPQAIARAAAEGWAGFKASWITNQAGGSGSRTPQPDNFSSKDYGQGGRL